MNILFEKNKANNEINEREKYILFAISYGDEEKANRSLDELEDLLKTAGGISVATMVQNLEIPDRATYLGKGKVAELKELMEHLDADAVLCDDELSPGQHRNLAEELDAKVVDRTMLILDIFAGRATTREGKIQVEMAQLKYRASRLTGKGTALSRLGGGIGTRGPGESKLEIDRRAIQRRVDSLSREIKTMEMVRQTTRKKRQGGNVPVIAIVGYTNAGKSTLLNRLTAAEILAEDKLFATLDPTTRVCRLPGGQEVLLTDTVGFINKLPHHLVDAFRSTLEEARYADIILHVVDGSNPDLELHMEVVYNTLKDLGIKEKPIITAFNKADKGFGQVRAGFAHESAGFGPSGAGFAHESAGFATPPCAGFAEYEMMDQEADEVVAISAKTGLGLEDLFAAIDRVLTRDRRYIEKLIPYSDSSKVSLIRRYGQILEEKYLDEGISIKAYVPKTMREV